MSPIPATAHTHRIKLRNDQPRPLDVYIEPWGDHLVLPPGATFNVAAHSSLAGALEVSVDAGSMTVYGWSGTTFEVYSADGGLLAQSSIPVP